MKYLQLSEIYWTSKVEYRSTNSSFDKINWQTDILGSDFYPESLDQIYLKDTGNIVTRTILRCKIFHSSNIFKFMNEIARRDNF